MPYPLSWINDLNEDILIKFGENVTQKFFNVDPQNKFYIRYIYDIVSYYFKFVLLLFLSRNGL